MNYFQLNFPSFLGKYFKGSRESEIKRNITPKKYKQLFDSLSDVQRRIIDDKKSQYIVVAAGPGSGKTKDKSFSSQISIITLDGRCKT